jgi:hypothetical protein
VEYNDRRENPRISMPLEIEFWCEGTCHRGRVEDLSEGGVYIYTGLVWPSTRTLEFRFHLPDDPEVPIRGRGMIVWTEPMGFGVQFNGLSPANLSRIKAFVDSESHQSNGRLAAMGL